MHLVVKYKSQQSRKTQLELYLLDEAEKIVNQEYIMKLTKQVNIIQVEKYAWDHPFNLPYVVLIRASAQSY